LTTLGEGFRRLATLLSAEHRFAEGNYLLSAVAFAAVVVWCFTPAEM
jgi:hypothetical protein